MATISLLITSSPSSNQNPYSALRFAQNVIASEHILAGIFFYEQGVLNANNLSVMPADEFNINQAWAELSKAYKIPLLVCVTAATKRGVLSSQDADESDKLHFNLGAPFQSVGLGELANLMHSSDRLIQF